MSSKFKVNRRDSDSQDEQIHQRAQNKNIVFSIVIEEEIWNRQAVTAVSVLSNKRFIVAC